MTFNETVLVLLISIGLFISSVLAHDVYKLQKRIVVLEQICHGQCKFGDQDCNERCQKAGHCPMQDQ